MAADAFAIMAILAMGAVTYITRIGGLWIMRYIPLTRRVQGFLEGLSGAVLVSLVAPAALDGDWAAKTAVAVALVVMLVTRIAALAMLAGVLTAAGVRYVMG